MVEEKDREDAAGMNLFIQHHALDQVKKGISRTFVLRDLDGEEPNRVLAYYTTSVGHLAPEDIPKVVSARMTIPVIFLLRLAVDRNFQRRGFGSKLLIHFLVQVVQLASQTGIYALVLEPLNERVKSFYQKFGLCPLPGDPNRMYVRVRDIEDWLKQN
jgi:GNAT superfamily N-acetyltransferase